MHERIMKQRAALVLSQPFFGALALRLAIIEDPTCESMWVDGVRLGYNPAYVDNLDDLELRGVLAHEVLHVANGHSWRMGARDQGRWNRACDYAVNPLVLNAQFKLPQGVLLDGRYLGKSAEEIYAMLRQKESSQSQDSPAGGRSSAPAPQPSGGQPPALQPNGCGEVRQYTGPDQPAVESEWRVAVNQPRKRRGCAVRCQAISNIWWRPRCGRRWTGGRCCIASRRRPRAPTTAGRFPTGALRIWGSICRRCMPKP